MDLGKVVCMSDPDEVAARDAAFLAGEVPPAVFPWLYEGVLDGGESTEVVGRLGLQARVAIDGRDGLADDLLGTGWTLLSSRADYLDELSAEQRAIIDALGMRHAHVSQAELETENSIVDVDADYSRWFAQVGAPIVIIRPDYYVFGLAKDSADLGGLLERLAAAAELTGTDQANELTGQLIHTDVDVDVIQVGYGPAGQVLAAYLGQRGHSVAVLERWPETYRLPRAGHLDHEAMRILQSIGAMETFRLQAIPLPDYNLVNADGEVLIHFDWDSPNPSGWKSDYFMFQPELEEAVDEAVRRHPSVNIDLAGRSRPWSIAASMSKCTCADWSGSTASSCPRVRRRRSQRAMSSVPMARTPWCGPGRHRMGGSRVPGAVVGHRHRAARSRHGDRHAGHRADLRSEASHLGVPLVGSAHRAVGVHAPQGRGPRTDA